MDETARGLVVQKLQDRLPAAAPAQQGWFEPYLAKVDSRMHRHYMELARNLRKTLVYQTGVSPLGLLRNCYDYALNDATALTGVFEAIRDELRLPGARAIFEAVKAVNDFRNTRVAHQEKPLANPDETKAALLKWVETLALLWQENADTIYARKCVVTLAGVTPKAQAAGGFSAEISGTLPEIELGPKGTLPTEYAQRLQEELTRLIQPIADYRFGAKGVRVECRETRSGTLEFWMFVTAITGGGYQFVKDYDKLRANSELLAKDIRRAAGKIKRSIAKFLGDSENPFKKAGGK
jgi:hypothetical protein